MKTIEEQLIDREDKNAPKKFIKPRFSFRTWQYLEDIWPRDVRLKRDEKGNFHNDCYKIMSVILFSIRKAQVFAKKEGVSLLMEDLFLLFWFQRVEEGRENAGAEDYQLRTPLDWCHNLGMIKRSRLVRAGLVEYFPGKLRLLRVTTKGKILMSKMLEDVEQAHMDVKECVKNQPLKGQLKMNKFLARFTDVWKPLEP